MQRQTAQAPKRSVKQNGGKRVGAGRPKGIPNKFRIIPTLKGEVMSMRQRYEVMPLDHMLKIINTTVVQLPDETDEEFSKRRENHRVRQDNAARCAAPYMHYRLNSIELTGREGESVRHKVDLSRLTDDEMVLLQKLTRKAEGGATLTIDQNDYYNKIIDDEERGVKTFKTINE